MKDSRILAPLALVGAIFAAVAVSLYIYAVPRPLWTTSSARVQGDYEFMGVYKGIPKQFAKQGYVGPGSCYSGDLWAYFAVKNRVSRYADVCKINGLKAETHGIKVQYPGSVVSPTNQVYLRAPMPSGYSPELQNGALRLLTKGRTVGSWQLTGMPSPKELIEASEPYKLEADALGYRIRLKTPIYAHAKVDSYGHLCGLDWHLKLSLSGPPADPRDRFELSAAISKTQWQAYDEIPNGVFNLPSLSGTLPVCISKDVYDRADRIEIKVKVKRYRTAKETVILRDVICERVSTQKSALNGLASYRIKGCSKTEFKTPGGLTIRLVTDERSNVSMTNGLTLSLKCDHPIGEIASSSSANTPTTRPMAFTSTPADSSGWYAENTWFKLPFKGGPKTVMLKELKLEINEEAALVEKTVTMMGPVK